VPLIQGVTGHEALPWFSADVLNARADWRGEKIQPALFAVGISGDLAPFQQLTMLWLFLFSLPIALGLFGFWVLCRLMFPANAPLLAAVRVGSIVYYLAVCLLTFSPVPGLIKSIYRIKPWGRYVMLGMGLGRNDYQNFHNVFVLACWIAVPAGWLAARNAYRNLPFD
jgi:hypothetical protein